MTEPNIVYIGFGASGESSDSRSKLAGISQSVYTEEVLAECGELEVFRVVDDNNVLAADNHLVVPMNKLKNFFSLSLFAWRLNKRPIRPNLVVLYHSLIWIFLIPILKVFNFKVVLQVNEVFYNAGTHTKWWHKPIERTLFKFCDAFIISSEIIVPFVRESGSLGEILGEIPGPLIQPFLAKSASTGENVKMVYAGVVDQVKNTGAFITLELSKKLDDEKFEIDIYGYGDESAIKYLNSEIEKNSKTSKTKVNFKGSIPPEKLSKCLIDYDVGLAIQGVSDSFGASSFPSKILHYISAGLDVVATGTPAVNCWKSRGMIYVYFDPRLGDLVQFLNNYQKTGENGASQASVLDSSIKRKLKGGINDFICRIS
ncbi:hypothetical protein N9X43_05195 [Gammaproteobacteria bacterium]|nr:hypothetical protein [Gammaproteobacteria bacterium]